jgi:hypothetical protein
MAEKVVFKIIASAMTVYNTPGGNKIGRIPKGITFQAEGDSRTELLGSVWWKHSAGWSIERTVDGTSVFLEQVGGPTVETPSSSTDATTVTAQSSGGGSQSSGGPRSTVSTETVTVDTGDTVVEAKLTVTETDPDRPENPLVQELAGRLAKVTKQANLRANGSVKIRDVADGTKTDSLIAGDLIKADMETVVERGGFYWVQHASGWSAIQSVAGDEVFFEDAGDVYVPGPDGPKVEEMPGYQSLIVRQPVDLDKTNFFQYFGNNSFAYMKGRDFNYHKFAQGLHSGLDYGSNDPANTSVKVYAGVTGTYVETLPDWKGRGWNKQLRVKTKEGYLLIYQHINPASFTAGQEIKPDTVVGTINANFPFNGDHLHLEIRYNNQAWIVNPLGLMLPELVSDIEAKFAPSRPGTGFSGSKLYYFYITDEWTKWGTPTDQPVIRRGGDPIDPRSLGA